MAIIMRHAAVIKLDFKSLLEILDFEGGKIHRVYTPDDFLNIGYCNVVIEHPDLEPVPESERLPEITPEYRNYYVDGNLVKVERVFPLHSTFQASASGD